MGFKECLDLTGMQNSSQNAAQVMEIKIILEIKNILERYRTCALCMPNKLNVSTFAAAMMH